MAGYPLRAHGAPRMICLAPPEAILFHVEEHGICRSATTRFLCYREWTCEHLEGIGHRSVAGPINDPSVCIQMETRIYDDIFKPLLPAEAILGSRRNLFSKSINGLTHSVNEVEVPRQRSKRMKKICRRTSISDKKSLITRCRN